SHAVRDRRYPHSLPTRRSSDLEQSLVTDKCEDADRDFEWALLLFLIDRLLLARDVPFPAPSADENDNAARIKHMFVGYARANDEDRKSTRLNYSHLGISYAVFC